MSPPTLETTVGEIVRAAPVRARIFERLGIDFCCGGKKPLAEACRVKGLDPATVLTMLEALETTPAPDLENMETMDLAELCEHIETVHHGYLREELPRLDFMTRKVAAVHGDHEPRLIEIRGIFTEFSPALVAQVVEEEETVFPLIRTVANGVDTIADRESLRRTMEKLEREHAQAAVALTHFRELTEGYTPPEWACSTFRALYNGLGRLESELRLHFHKENNILFPRALAHA